MKICPFVSHLLGDDNSKTWTIERADAGADAPEPKGGPVVILGYDDGGSSVATQPTTQVAKKTRSKADTSSPLYCLKESCRFYKEKTGDCQFDLIFSMLENGKKQSPGLPDATTKELAKDIDKIWKFQTKSVSELIKSLGDAEKSQAKSVQNIGKDLEKSLDILAAKFDKTSGGSDVKKSIATLQKKLDDREQSIEDLASTVSELVLNLHENIRQLDSKWDDSFKRVDEMSRSVPDEAKMKKLMEETVSGRMKELSPPDFSKALSALDDRLEAMMKNQQRPNPKLEEKLQAALDARADLEAESRAFQEKIADRIQDFRTQQKIWEERLRKVADHQGQILEHLKDLKKQRENDRGRTDQKEARKHNNLGVASFHNGAYEMARDQFLHAVKIDPEFAEAYNNLGLAYTELDEDEHATEAFSRAVELNPDLHAAYNNLGYIFFRKGNYDQAIEMYNEALTRSTDNSSAYTNLGNAYFKLGRRDDAKKAWTKALEIDPGNEKAKRNLDRTRAGSE
jgi:Flp pilus assembly protein TadD